MNSNPVRRCWINQPSSLQPLHHMHGMNVLAAKYTEDSQVIYFLSGDVVSSVVPNNVLSKSWRK